MNEELISVIMCVYNEHKNDLRLAIESILRQSYYNFEFLILIENETNEELVDIVKEYSQKDSRIRIFCNEERLGFPKTLNLGINYSKGELIARMDADDISSLNRLKIQKEYMDCHQDVSLVSGNMVFINENNKVINRNVSYNNIDRYVDRLMMYGNVVAHPCVMYRKKDIESLGGYRNLDAAEDYDLWLRMLINNKKIRVINSTLLKYRIRGNSASNRRFLKLFLTTKILRQYYKKRRSPSVVEIDNYIVSFENKRNVNKIIESFSKYDLAWKKKRENHFLAFIFYFFYSSILNFDLIFVTRDSLIFRYLLNKAKH